MNLLIILLLSFTAVSASKMPKSIEATENHVLVGSLEDAIQQYMEDDQGPGHGHMPPPMAGPPVLQIPPVSKMGSESDARGFVKYAGAAYCPMAKLKNWSCANCDGFASGASEVEYFFDFKSSTAAYLAVNNGQKTIIVGFRGTQDITNWIGNINILFTTAEMLSPFEHAYVHSGFNGMANILLPSVEVALSSAMARHPEYRVVFTGHSLGGALATLTAYRLAQKGVISWKHVNLITYGQPRVGNPEFARFLNSRPMNSTRVTSYKDLVPISPGIRLGYGHSQYNMYINKYGKTVECSIYQEDRNCINDFTIPSVEAHFTYWDQRMNSAC